jgi:hypothetical protein
MPSFIKTGSGIQKLMGRGGIHRHTDSTEITYAYSRFYKIRNIGYKKDFKNYTILPILL